MSPYNRASRSAVEPEAYVVGTTVDVVGAVVLYCGVHVELLFVVVWLLVMIVFVSPYSAARRDETDPELTVVTDPEYEVVVEPVGVNPS